MPIKLKPTKAKKIQIGDKFWLAKGLCTLIRNDENQFGERVLEFRHPFTPRHLILMIVPSNFELAVLPKKK